MRIYVCDVTEICFEEKTITIKMPDELEINGLGKVFVVDEQNMLKGAIND